MTHSRFAKAETGLTEHLPTRESNNHPSIGTAHAVVAMSRFCIGVGKVPSPLAKSFPVNLNGGPMTAADLNGDGKPDVVYAVHAVGAIGEICALLNTSR